MKIMFVVSLFSGLESSVSKARWKPSGVPTIYKLINALVQSPHEVIYLFTCKDKQSKWTEGSDKTLILEGLKTKVIVLAGVRAIPRWLGFLRGYLKEIRQIWSLWRIYRRFRPNLLYFDRANLWAAGLFARCFKTPVVLRVMGVKYDMLEALNGKRPIHFIMRWAYRANYASIICTQDGSGVEFWAKKALNQKSSRKILINGVDMDKRGEVFDPRLMSLPKDRTIVMFLGRLEKVKGCDEFLGGFLQALEKEKTGLHALIIGEGSRSEFLCEMIESYDANDSVTFIDELPHDQIIMAHELSDIYVSLNHLGNLSNANLEAMKSGRCMILPRSQPEQGIDLVTDEIIPETAALRIPNASDTKLLAEAILYLHRNPAEREERGKAMAKVAQSFIPSWDSRIKVEINLLQRASKQA